MGLLERVALGVGRGRLVHEILEILFPELEAEFAVHYVAVAAEYQVEIEFFGGVESLDPVVGIGVAHEGSPSVERIACDDYFFVGEEDEDVAVGMGAAKPEDFYGARAVAEDQAAVERSRLRPGVDFLRSSSFVLRRTPFPNPFSDWRFPGAW